MNQAYGASSFLRMGLVAVLLTILSVPSLTAVELPLVTEEGIIAGEMNIEFQTRTSRDLTGKLAEGSPAENTKDKYEFALNVAKTTEFSGSITRQPRLFSKVLGREKQPAELQYDVTLSVRNPSNLDQKRSVGKWVGLVPVDDKGVYRLDGGSAKGSPLRMAI
ncbi:MAG: hypothetical protein AB1656_01800, partial [Candidatus Omnitrophota bacterium]